MQDEAKIDYLGGMKYKEIAEKYNVSINTVKSWKQRHRWSRDTPQKVAPQKKGCTQKEVRPNLAKALKGNKNAVGNKGGAAPKGNHNAMTHGLYAKYLPAETLELAKGLSKVSPIDMQWDAICIKYAAIIRAQSIMYVKDKDEIIKHTKSQSEKSTTYEFQRAWDRQASFLNAQSRAMQALTNMIKQYEELCHCDLANEEQRLRVQKLKTEIESKSSPEKTQDNMMQMFGSINQARKELGIS